MASAKHFINIFATWSILTGQKKRLKGLSSPKSLKTYRISSFERSKDNPGNYYRLNIFRRFQTSPAKHHYEFSSVYHD